MESYYAELKLMFTRMNNWFKMVAVEDKPDGDSVRQATALAKEMRETIKLMATIDGVIGERANTQSEDDLRREIDKLKTILFTELCPICQQHIIESLEA